jgi:hypothetical protein
MWTGYLISNQSQLGEVGNQNPIGLYQYQALFQQDPANNNNSASFDKLYQRELPDSAGKRI